MHNYIEFFRFSDKYEDVFIEDNHYLYACAEPNGWTYMFYCNVYRITDAGELIREDGASADAAYLKKLTPAPPDIAAQIIKAETRRYCRYCIEPNEYDILIDEDAENERAIYCEYKFAEIDKTVQALEKAA